MIVVLATGNPGKAREIAQALADGGVEWRTLQNYPKIGEPHESGRTFEENAELKARYYHRHTGEPTLAEDSGLEVDALDGAPGVYSARFAGEPSDADANNRKLLAVLAGLPPARRRARFVSVCALVLPDGRVELTRGTVEGRIAEACAGTHGFGYDAVFIPDGYDTTFGVLGLDVKQRISHRFRALRAMVPLLRAAQAGAERPA